MSYKMILIAGAIFLWCYPIVIEYAYELAIFISDEVEKTLNQKD